MRLALFTAATAALLLAACGSESDPSLNQVGAQPDLPPMNIAMPTGWEGELPTVPDGYVITPIATELQIPRQMLMLPNGDLLVAEGRGGGAPPARAR